MSKQVGQLDSDFIIIISFIHQYVRYFYVLKSRIIWQRRMHRHHEGDGEVMGKSAISSTENGQEADPPEGDGEVMRKSAISSTENGQAADPPVIPQEIKDRWERYIKYLCNLLIERNLW